MQSVAHPRGTRACDLLSYFGKQNGWPFQVGVVATIKEPVLVRATALIVFFPNAVVRMLRQVVGVTVRGLKFFLQARAQRPTCAFEQVCTIAPLLIQFAKVFRTAVVGRGRLAEPHVWLNRVLN